MRDVDAGQVVTEVFATFGRRDVEAFLVLVTEDVEFWPHGTATISQRSEPYRGHAGMREYFRDVAALWEELVLIPGELRIAGNGVVAFGRAQGRTIADGDRHDVPVIWVFRLQDGRVSSARISLTGALPEPG